MNCEVETGFIAELDVKDNSYELFAKEKERKRYSKHRQWQVSNACPFDFLDLTTEIIERIAPECCTRLLRVINGSFARVRVDHRLFWHMYGVAAVNRELLKHNWKILSVLPVYSWVVLDLSSRDLHRPVVWMSAEARYSVALDEAIIVPCSSARVPEYYLRVQGPNRRNDFPLIAEFQSSGAMDQFLSLHGESLKTVVYGPNVLSVLDWSNRLLKTNALDVLRDSAITSKDVRCPGKHVQAENCRSVGDKDIEYWFKNVHNFSGNSVLSPLLSPTFEGSIIDIGVIDRSFHPEHKCFVGLPVPPKFYVVRPRPTSQGTRSQREGMRVRQEVIAECVEDNIQNFAVPADEEHHGRVVVQLLLQVLKFRCRIHCVHLDKDCCTSNGVRTATKHLGSLGVTIINFSLGWRQEDLDPRDLPDFATHIVNDLARYSQVLCKAAGNYGDVLYGFVAHPQQGVGIMNFGGFDAQTRGWNRRHGKEEHSSFALTDDENKSEIGVKFWTFGDVDAEGNIWGTSFAAPVAVCYAVAYFSSLSIDAQTSFVVDRFSGWLKGKGFNFGYKIQQGTFAYEATDLFFLHPTPLTQQYGKET